MITPRVMAESAKIRTINTAIAALEAGVDITGVPFFICPKDVEIIRAGIIVATKLTGHADKCTIEVKNGTTVIAGDEYKNGDTVNAGTYSELILAASQAKQPQGSILTCSVTNGTGQASPAMVLQVDYIIDEDV